MSAKIAILTFTVGADYKRAMEPGLASKRAYCSQHGYAFHEGGEDVWDRTRPIAWSKIKFILKYLDAYDYIFWSDGDVIITNPTIKLKELMIPMLEVESGKDMLWCRDACGNLNNGNVLFRGGCAWVRDFLQRAYACEQFIHHIWWDNAAFCHLYEMNATDREHIVTCEDPARFNAYLFDRQNAAESEARLFKPGDFLVHFAGVYDIWNIHRFMIYIERCMFEKKAPNKALLTHWRTKPPTNKVAAYHDAKTVLIA